MSAAAIQTAVYLRLAGFGALTALLASGQASIYDRPPQPARPEDESTFPVLTLGDDDHLSWDTDTTDGDEATLRIHVWSRHSGRIQTKEIQEQIYQALHHHDLVVDGLPAVLLHFVTSTAGPDQDGRTQHGVSTFRLLMERA